MSDSPTSNNAETTPPLYAEPKRRSRAFQWLMRLLPAEFRGDYGTEMEQVFAEQREEAARSGDTLGIWRLWWETAKGIFTTAPAEHWSMLKQGWRRSRPRW